MTRRKRLAGSDAAPTGFAAGWLSALRSLGFAVPEGRSARVGSLEFDLAGARADVRTADGASHAPRLALRHLPERVFESAARTLAGKARFAAGLLAGRVPAGIEAVFAAAGGELLPRSGDELVHACTCEEKDPFCSHLAALHALVAERLERDPFLLILLRGMERDGFLALMRRYRAPKPPRSGVLEAPGPIPLPALRVVPREPLPEVRPEAFFKPSRPVAALRGGYVPPEAPEALLARLGPSPLADPEAVAFLAELHRAIGLGAKERLSEWEWQRVLRSRPRT